jgi:hypothetical protein
MIPGLGVIIRLLKYGVLACMVFHRFALIVIL